MAESAIYGDVLNELPLLSLARVAAWIAALNFSYVALGLISPIFQLVHQLFNVDITHRSFHSIHFHRTAATSGIIFSMLHIIFLLVPSSESGCYVAVEDVQSLNVCGLSSIITGCLIMVGVVGAWITGHLTRSKKSTFSSTLHFPFACIAFSGLLTHVLNPDIIPYSIFVVLITLVACLTIYALFFLINPIQPLDIDRNGTVWLTQGGEYSFLVVNCDVRKSIPPGSFFLIYANQQSMLSNFHAHAFPVFSSHNNRISFLIRCRIPPKADQLSFTQRLSLGEYPPLPPPTPLYLLSVYLLL